MVRSKGIQDLSCECVFSPYVKLPLSAWMPAVLSTMFDSEELDTIGLKMLKKQFAQEIHLPNSTGGVSSKVKLPHTVDFRALCSVNAVTLEISMQQTCVDSRGGPISHFWGANGCRI